MSLFGRLRLDSKFEGIEIAAEQETPASQKAAVAGAARRRETERVRGRNPRQSVLRFLRADIKRPALLVH